MRRTLAAAALVLAAGCAPAKPAVQLDEMSAAQHRREAERERLRAADEFARYQPHAMMATPGADGTVGARYAQIDPFPFNPTERALRDGERHLRHAREHEAAAALLERYEGLECGGLSPAARSACPILGPIERVVDLADGVRLTFSADRPVDAIVTQMRCHQAFARTRGFHDAGDCPLYLRGVDIALTPDGHAIEVRSSDAAVAAAIQVDSRLVSGR